MAQSNHSPEPVNELILDKHGQRWVFRYAPGDEQSALNAIESQARNPQSQFNWFDAAVLSHRLGERLGRKLNRQTNS